MKILIIGANGQVGQALQQAKPDTKALSRKELDLTTYDGNAETLKTLCQGNPDVIINASAYTQVDKCESEEETAMQINANAVQALQKASHDLGARFVHYSTDYIFDGNGSTPYKETHAPSPINMYGKTKLAGEKHLNENDLLIRTSWVHSPHGNNFIKTMLKLMDEKQSLDVVGDQFGIPTSAKFIAEKTYALLQKNLTGIYNVVPDGQTNWYQFACFIKEQANKTTSINKVSSIDYNTHKTQAKRPHYAVLCNEKLKGDLQQSLPDWQIGAKETLQALEAK